jgi:hypothetical protein
MSQDTAICRDLLFFLFINSLLLLLQTFDLRTYARMHIPTILQTPEQVEMAVGEENFIWILDAVSRPVTQQTLRTQV